MLAGEAQVALAHSHQLFQRAVAGGETLLAVALVERQGPIDKGRVDALLAAEMGVDRADGDIGRLGEVLHRGRAVAATEEEMLGGFEDRARGARLAALGPRWRGRRRGDGRRHSARLCQNCNLISVL